MTAWQKLIENVNEFEQQGYERIESSEVYGVPVTVLEYKLFETPQYGEGVSILINHPKYEDPKYFTSHGAVVVRAFKNPKVDELISSKEPVTFRLIPTLNGKSHYVTLE